MQNRQAPPTYLNYRNGAAHNAGLPQPPSSPSRPPPPPPPPAAVQAFSNSLLILISGAPCPDLQAYLATILSRYTINEISIIAKSEEVLKVSRMDVYTAVGKARQEIYVTTATLEAPISSAELSRATRGLENKTLSGVLLCQHRHTQSEQSVPATPSTPRDILDYDDVELEESWRTNLLTLHTLARVTVPLLRRAPLQPSPFFCLDSSLPLSPLDAAAQDSLLQLLSSSPASQGLRFGMAKEELVTAAPQSLVLDIPNANGNSSGSVNGQGAANDMYHHGQQSDGGLSSSYSPLPESPTKLWASWSMMYE